MFVNGQHLRQRAGDVLLDCANAGPGGVGHAVLPDSGQDAAEFGIVVGAGFDHVDDLIAEFAKIALQRTGGDVLQHEIILGRPLDKFQDQVSLFVNVRVERHAGHRRRCPG
jgi:hypothetical protein